LARTMVADRPSNVVTQIVNRNDKEVRLQKGTCFGNLEEVVPVVGVPSDEDNADSSSHIECVIDDVDESLSSEHRTDFRQLILKHSDVFSKGDHDFGCATVVKHRIDTGTCQPVRQALRRQPPHYVAEIDRQLDE